jgi:hypothetical protein
LKGVELRLLASRVRHLLRSVCRVV